MVSNLQIIRYYFFISHNWIFNILIYYNVSSKLNFYYSDIKNKLTDDNKYLAMVTDSGLWIKDEINNKTYN